MNPNESQLIPKSPQHHGDGPKTFHLIVKGMAAAMLAGSKPIQAARPSDAGTEGQQLAHMASAPAAMETQGSPPSSAAAAVSPSTGYVSPASPHNAGRQQPATAQEVHPQQMPAQHSAQAMLMAQQNAAMQAAMYQQQMQHSAAMAAMYQNAVHQQQQQQQQAYVRAMSPGLSPQMAPMGSPPSPSTLYPRSPQFAGYPRSPGQYPASFGQQYAMPLSPGGYYTPYTSPWHMASNAGGVPPPLSLSPSVAQSASTNTHVSSLATDSYAAGHVEESHILQSVTGDAQSVESTQQGHSGSELRARQPYRYTEEEEVLTGGDGVGEGAGHDPPAVAAAALERDNPDPPVIVDAMAGAPDAGDPGGAPHWRGWPLIKFVIMVFVFFNDLDALRLLAIVSGALVCYLYANGYMNFIGRALFRNGLPRPRLRADVVAAHAAVANVPDVNPAPEAAARAQAAAGAPAEQAAGGEQSAAQDASVQQAGVDVGAPSAATTEAEGNADEPADETAETSGIAAPPPPPPLSFFGTLNNILLAFVASLFPAWEAAPQAQ
eukprot:SAG31_NODE_2638_length_5328_cov_2.459552_2_plen_547_part_00